MGGSETPHSFHVAICSEVPPATLSLLAWPRPFGGSSVSSLALYSGSPFPEGRGSLGVRSLQALVGSDVWWEVTAHLRSRFEV